MFVANGQGLIAVIKPSNNAVIQGMELLSSRFVRKSIRRFWLKNVKRE
jgi:hypothetical protein